MTRGIWTDKGIHLDVADGTTEAEIEKIKAFADNLLTERNKRKAAFNQVWEAGQVKGDKEAAWKWFDLGCDWQSQRQAQ